MTEKWIEEFNEYQELVEHNKGLRPECSDPDGHYMVSYDSLGYKECDVCNYQEDIYTRMDEKC